MKKTTDRILPVLAIGALLGLIAMFMAFHDIGQDYLSPGAMTRHAMPEAPEYSQCALEWNVAQKGFVAVTFFVLAYLTAYATEFVRNRSEPATQETQP